MKKRKNAVKYLFINLKKLYIDEYNKKINS